MNQSQQAWINFSFKFFFLALPLLYFPALVDPGLVPRLIFLNVFSLVLILFIIRSKEFMVDNRFFSQRLFLVCAGWIAANFLSGIFCVNAAEWISGLSKYFLYILFFLLLSVFLLSDKLDGKELTKSIILFAAVVIVIVFVQIFRIIYYSPDVFWRNLDLISSSIGNKNLLSSCLFLTFPFLLMADTLNKSWKRLSIFLFSSELLVIIVLQSRAVWLASLVFLIVLFFFRKKIVQTKRSRRSGKVSITMVFMLLFVLAVGIIYAVNYFDSQFGQRVFAYANNFNTANTRFLLWENSIAMTLDHFFLGVGTNNWQIWFPYEGLSKFNAVVANGISTYQRPHNDFLWVFSETGVLGFICFLFIFLTAIRYCFRLIRNTTDEPSIKKYVFFVATITGYAVISCVDFPLERVEHNVIFFTILAIITTDYLRRFNYTGRKRELKKNMMMALAAFSIFTLVVLAGRLTGEYHSHLLINAHGNKDWDKMITEKKRGENIFYNMDFFSAPLAWYSGVAYFNLDDLFHATEEFESAYRVHPYNIHVLNNLGSCYEKNNRHAEAIAFYKKGLKISPDFRESILNLSGAYFNSGDIENAYREIDRCILDTTDMKYMIFLKAILQKKEIPIEKFISLKKESQNKTL